MLYITRRTSTYIEDCTQNVGLLGLRRPIRPTFFKGIGAGDGEAGGHVPPKIREKYFSGN